MNDLLNGLSAAKVKADARGNFQRYVAAMRQQGWSDADVKEYSDGIGVLMASDDEKSLALFPPGTYANAEAARSDARQFWSDQK